MAKPFHILTVGGEDYKLVFSASATIAAEEKLGAGIMAILGNKSAMTGVSTQVTLLWAALQKYQHGIKMSDAAEIYDDLMAEQKGNGMGVLIEAINGALVAAGFIPPAPTPEEKPKKKKTTEESGK